MAAVAALLVGCGGSGGDDEAGETGEQLQGFFLDDAVEGLEYRSGTGPIQTTDENGTFTYSDGSPLTFLVDGVPVGTVDNGAARCTPLDFGTAALNVARFLQSVDQTPGTPGIDLTGVDLADTPIDFSQSNDDFTNDPAVNQAVTDAATTGGGGVLVDAVTAQAALDAALSTTFAATDFNDKTFFYASADGVDSGILMFATGGSGKEFPLEDAIDETLSDFRGESFAWTIENDQLALVFGAVDVCTISRLGLTANRYSVTAECVDEGEVDDPVPLTVFEALPLEVADLSGNSVVVTVPGEGPETYAFNANFTGTLSYTEEGQTEVESFQWAIANNVLTVMSTELNAPVFDRAFLISGTITSGTLAFLAGETDGANPDGGAFTEEEFELVGEITDLALVTLTP